MLALCISEYYEVVGARVEIGALGAARYSYDQGMLSYGTGSGYAMPQREEASSKTQASVHPLALGTLSNNATGVLLGPRFDAAAASRSRGAPVLLLLVAARPDPEHAVVLRPGEVYQQQREAAATARANPRLMRTRA